MKNQTRFFLAGVAVVILLVILAQYILRSQTSLKLPKLSTRNFLQSGETIISPTVVVASETVIIDFGNGQKLTGEATTQNAYQALVKVAKDNNLLVKVKEYKYGVMVEKIGDTAGTQNSAWMYSVNGKPGQIAADRYIIYPGDKVEWKFTKF